MKLSDNNKNLVISPRWVLEPEAEKLAIIEATTRKRPVIN
jgi:hypothetical protein